MFSTKLTRAAHRATAASPFTAAAAVTATSTSATARRPIHQRRHSSSKTSSCPPDNNTSKPAPAAKAEAGEQESKAPVSGGRSGARSTKGRSRGGYRKVGQTTESKKSASPSAPVDQFAGLPSVPSIQGLDLKDLTLSSFFSLHRPISLTTTIPPPSTPEAFGQLFSTQQQQQDVWANGNTAEGRPEEFIYSLQNTIDALDSGAQNSEEDSLRWDIVQESQSNSDGVKHLDGNPKLKNLDELVAQFRPFKTPPPPQPFVEAGEQKKEKKVVQKVTTRGRPKQKTFTATITVTESTHADGHKTYSASSSPIVRLPDAAQKSEQQQSIREPSTKQRQPFLTRMYRRRRANAASNQVSKARTAQSARRAPSPRRQERMKMFLISVKRQRKLKMKKHKYKKLMKRTRNLRRRLEKTT